MKEFADGLVTVISMGTATVLYIIGPLARFVINARSISERIQQKMNFDNETRNP
jgi:hypothetical protein